MAAGDEIEQDVYTAIEAVAHRDEDTLFPTIARLEESQDAGSVLVALAKFAAMLRASKSPQLADRVNDRIDDLAPEDPQRRSAFEAFARSLFLDDDVDNVLGSLRDSGATIDDTARGDNLLAAIFVAGRVAGDLGAQFEWASGRSPATLASANPAAPMPAPPPTASRPAVSRSVPRRARRKMSPFTIFFGIIGLVIIPWSIYANQDAQRFRCVAYKISGVSRPLPWTITCFLNGNS